VVCNRVCPWTLWLIIELSVLGLVLQVLVWVVKSNVQNSITTAFIGLLYGPIFPGILGIANDVLPGEVHMVAMALMWVMFSIFSGTLTLIVFSNAFASLGGGTLDGCLVRFQELSLPISSCLSCSYWDGSQLQRSLCINVYHRTPRSLHGCIVGIFPVSHSNQGLICLTTHTSLKQQV